jgi:hypothetical protein
MRTLLLSVLLASSFAVACTAESTSPSSSPSSSSTPPAGTESDKDVLSTDREVGECGSSMKPLDEPTVGQPTTAAPKVTAKGTSDAIVFLAAHAGVDCSGGEIVAKKSDGNFIDVALRFQRVDGEPVATNCFCANAVDVKGTIKDLAAGHYELRVVREQMRDGKPVEEVITPTSVGVDVGG